MKERFGVLSEPVEPLLIDDLTWGDGRLYYDRGKNCLFYDELARASSDTDEEAARLQEENNGHLADGEERRIVTTS